MSFRAKRGARSRGICISVVALFCLVASATAHAQRGALFIVGGGPQPPALVKDFVDRAGGAGKAKIIVFAEASVDGEKSGEEKAKELRALGATAINIWITREQANTDSVAKLLADATGIWFGGGDQSRLTGVIGGTKTEAAIHARFEHGAVVGGTSAGAAVMSAVMITGDERHPGGDRPVKDSSSAYLTIARDNIITAPGLSLITDAIIDQHFLRRKRHNRLISLVLERPEHLGAGIDESTALIVEASGFWRVAGASVVVIYDARKAKITPAGSTLGASGIIMHVLPAGALYEPREGKVLQ